MFSYASLIWIPDSLSITTNSAMISSGGLRMPLDSACLRVTRRFVLQTEGD